MKHIIILSLLMLTAVSIPANAIERCGDTEVSELRQKIGLDYSMPDYSVKKIDERVIGSRLAFILNHIVNHNMENNHNTMLSSLLRKQNENLRYVSPKKVKVKEIIKQDNKINILLKIWLQPNGENLYIIDVPITFIDGISGSDAANRLFMIINRLYKE